MKILVTGGFGFIGGHLIARLLKDGHYVHVVDDLSSNPIPYQDLLAEIGSQKHLNYSLDSIQDLLISTMLPHWDAIYHLASPVGPAGILRFGGSLAKQIIDDTAAVTHLALEKNACLIYVSTSEVYGGGVDGLCAEDTPRIVQPNTTVRLEYAVGKLAGETAVLNTPNLDAVIIRPFNVAGPRQSTYGGFVLPRFVDQALKQKPLTVFGDGRQIRAFTHVADIVDGLVLAMERGLPGQSYNLGNPANLTTILELAQRVIQHVGSGTVQFTDPKTIFGPLYAEAHNKYPDATKAMTELGWKPTRGIDETIADAIAYTVRAAV